MIPQDMEYKAKDKVVVWGVTLMPPFQGRQWQVIPAAEFVEQAKKFVEGINSMVEHVEKALAEMPEAEKPPEPKEKEPTQDELDKLKKMWDARGEEKH